MGPVLRELAPAADGGALLVSWSWPGTQHWSTSGGEPLHYVVEWMSVPATELQWQKLDKNPNNASITGTESQGLQLRSGSGLLWLIGELL